MYLCYRKKWLSSGLRSSRRLRSLTMSAPHRDLHRLPNHVRYIEDDINVAVRASVMITWRGSDVSLLAWLVQWVLLLCHPWVHPSPNYMGAPVVPPVSLVICLVCVFGLSAASYAPRTAICATSAGVAWQWARRWWWCC